MGLAPAGDHGSYFQQVAFTGVQTLPQSSASIEGLPGGTLALKLGDDYVTSNQTQTQDVDIDAPIVFVGYGIEAPEFHWNDYQGVDVKGKVVLGIVNEPPSKDPKYFNGEALTYYGRWVYKYEQAARQGAVTWIQTHRLLATYGFEANLPSAKGGSPDGRGVPRWAPMAACHIDDICLGNFSPTRRVPVNLQVAPFPSVTTRAPSLAEVGLAWSLTKLMVVPNSSR